eukprot:EC690215.1.p2 GENE.EC690215.1~~EC690215.1.p2  ORF type:complete len:78 (-),score=3.56 EC690215.1:378-611(-)
MVVQNKRKGAETTCRPHTTVPEVARLFRRKKKGDIQKRHSLCKLSSKEAGQGSERAFHHTVVRVKTARPLTSTTWKK